jgi:hypothetical protein
MNYTQGTLKFFLMVDYFDPFRETRTQKRITLMTIPGIEQRDCEGYVAKMRDVQPGCIAVFKPDPVWL